MKNKSTQITKEVIISSLVLFFVFSTVFVPTAHGAFRFIAWGDSRGNPSELAKLAGQAKALNPQPAFTIFGGDLIPTNGTGTTTDKLNAWKNGINANGSAAYSDITFPARGNHDLPDTTAWTNFFRVGPPSDLASIAAKVKVSNYQALNEDLTYSFDYQNSHFVAVDIPGTNNLVTAAQIAWVDNDLSTATGRGMKHAFLYWHGPLYTVDGHMTSVNTALATMLNKHPIVTALFPGHEHVLAHTTLNKNNVPQFTNITVEQFVSGAAGAGFYSCTAGRSDFCQTVFGYMVVDVLSDTQTKTTIYKDGSATPIWERTFTKGQVGPTTTFPPTVPVSITPTPKNTPTPPTGTIPGDINGDGHVDITDFQLLSNSFGKSLGQTGYNAKADFNHDNTVDVLDFQTLSNNFGK